LVEERPLFLPPIEKVRLADIFCGQLFPVAIQKRTRLEKVFGKGRKLLVGLTLLLVSREREMYEKVADVGPEEFLERLTEAIKDWRASQSSQSL
jgi:hypothetical protein